MSDERQLNYRLNRIGLRAMGITLAIIAALGLSGWLVLAWLR